MFVKHDHGVLSYTHIHAEFNDRIVCKVCGWKGSVSECEVKYFGALPLVGHEISFCPGQRQKRVLLFFKKLIPCKTKLVFHGEEATILLLEGAEPQPAEFLS